MNRTRHFLGAVAAAVLLTCGAVAFTTQRSGAAPVARMSPMCQAWSAFQPYAFGPTTSPGTTWVSYTVYAYQAFAGDTVWMNVSLPQGSDGTISVLGAGGTSIKEQNIGGGFSHVSYRLPRDVGQIELGFVLTAHSPKSRQGITVAVGCTGPCRLPGDNGGGVAGELLGRVRCVTSALTGAINSGHTSRSAKFTPKPVPLTAPPADEAVAARTATPTLPLSVPTTSATPTPVVEAPTEPASAAEAVVVTAP